MPKRNGNDGKSSDTHGAREKKRLLREIKARDEWQSQLITLDGTPCGIVVRKVVEPAAFLVRYLVVYRHTEDRHLLVPASTVIGGDMGEIYCTLSGEQVERLPTYTFTEITQSLEQAIYDAVGQAPYWIEEAGRGGEEDD